MAFQEQEIRQLCGRLGHDVVRVHSDTVSGALTTRPGFRAWLADAGEVDLLATWAIDRASRSGILGAAAIMEVIEGKPTRFMTVDGLDSEQPGFGMNLAIRAEIAREERQRFVERSKATRKRLLLEGRHPSGSAPYGTRLNAERRLEPDPAEAAVLQEVAQKLLAGQSVRSVVVWMNDQGLTTRRGNPWTRGGLTATLETESSRLHVFTLAEQRALSSRLHPSPGSRPVGGRPVTWLLSGYAQCAGCSRPLTRSRDARRDVTRYVCPTVASVAPCPARVTIRADRADAFVEAKFLERLGDGYWWEERITIDSADVDEAERNRDVAQAALLSAPGPETLHDYQAAQGALDKAIGRPAVRRRELVATERYKDLWSKGDTPARATLLRGATESIEIARSTSGPTWDRRGFGSVGGTSRSRNRASSCGRAPGARHA